MASKNVGAKTETPEKNVKMEPEIAEKNVIEEAPAPEKKERFVPRALDPNQIVTVRNGFQGKLTYTSKKTGETWTWDEFKDEQDMELGELKNARSSYKKFFIDNWFMIDDPEIIAYLGVEQYYKYALNIDHFDELFEMSPAEVEDRVGKLSAGQRKSVAYRAKQLIAEGEIDSNKVIAALEKSLGVELIER